MISESNTAAHFEDFIIGLKSKCEGKRVIIVLDNLKIHYAKKLNYLYDKDFKDLFLPPYSSQLNPIERLWSLLKNKRKKNLLLYVEELMGIKDTRS
jgi:transposase